MPTMVPRDSALAAVAESSALTTGIDNPIDVAHQTTLCRYFAILIIVTLSESGILHKTAGFPSSHAAADPRAVALYRGQPDSKTPNDDLLLGFSSSVGTGRQSAQDIESDVKRPLKKCPCCAQLLGEILQFESGGHCRRSTAQIHTLIYSNRCGEPHAGRRSRNDAGC